MSVTYLEAIRAAQEKALQDDPKVFIYGQDVGRFGGRLRRQKIWRKSFPAGLWIRLFPRTRWWEWQ